MFNNLKIDNVNTNAYTKFGKILSLCSLDKNGNKIINEILISIKGHNSIINAWKIMYNNPNLDLVNINIYTKFGEIISICFQDIEPKWNENGWMDRRTDGQTEWKMEWWTTQIQYSPFFQIGAIIISKAKSCRYKYQFKPRYCQYDCIHIKLVISIISICSQDT